MSLAGDNRSGGPLTGVRVVEIGSGIAVPVAARLLAESGADVVKVEASAGDPARERLPAGFATWNRGKRSVVLDLETPSARTDLLDLVDRADLVLHDLPAARATDLGLSPAAMAETHPHVVVAEAPSYPAGHPRADEVVPDTLVQAAEGLMDEQQGFRDGPVFVRIPYSSWSAAYLLATGAVARLVQREHTGAVLPIATSLFQGALTTASLYWQRSERLPAPITRHTLPKIDPDAALSIFECADGRWVQLAGAVGGWIESPPVIEALALMDRVELSEVGVTRANQELWNEVFRQHESAWWDGVLAQHDVPCMIVRELGECFTSDQARLNDHVVLVDDAVVGTALQAGPPVQTTPCGEVGRPAPALGSTAITEVVEGWDPRPERVPATTPTDTRPLAGLRGLDFGTVVAGPFGAQCLADLGVDLVKVEPLQGDRGRQLTQFAGCHRGKRSIALDLKSPAARPVLDDLLRSSDVVLHNMRLGAASRLGLDGPGLRAVNPHLVFSHVSAYGTVGPMATMPGYDPTAQAFTGWEHAIAGEGNPPVWFRSSVFDVHAGLAAAYGAVVSLFQRARTGVPGDAATSLLAVGITASSELVVDPVTGVGTPVPVLDRGQHGIAETHRTYRTSDGWIAVAADTESSKMAFRGVVGDGDPAEILLGRPTREVLDAFEVAQVPASVVRLDQMQAFHDEPLHRDLGVSRCLETAGYGRIELVGGWWDLGPAAATESVPALGEHTAELLQELGLDQDAIAELADVGVIGLGDRVPSLTD